MRGWLRAAVWGGFFICSTAAAEPVCGHRETFVSVLERDYAEVEIGRGLTPAGQLIELFVSPQRSFTILVTTADGLSCIVAAGQDWDSAVETAMPSPLLRDKVPR
jgi:hypothetical protein